MSALTVIAALAGAAAGAAATVATFRRRSRSAPRRMGQPGRQREPLDGSTLEPVAHTHAERLHRLAAALSRAASPPEVGAAFLDQAVEQLGAQGGSLVLRSADGSALELIAGRDLPGAKARLLARVPIQAEFSVTAAYRTGQPAAARSHAEMLAKFPTSARTFGPQAQAIYALPLRVGAQTAGAFNLFFDHEHEVGTADATFLATMAQLCGQALERALLVEAESSARERAEESARYANSLYSLGMRLASALTPTDVATIVMREAIAQHGAAAAAVGLIDHERQEVELLMDDGYPEAALEVLRRFSLDAPIPAAAAARSSTPVFVGTLAERRERFPNLPKNLGDGSVAIAGLPLIVAGRTIGVLVLRYTEERPFRSDERRFLLTLADDCSQALDRARLHAQTERRADRARLLVRVASSLDAASTYLDRAEALLRALVPELADFASIETLGPDGEPEPVAEHLAEGFGEEEAALLRGAAGDMLERVLESGLPECIPLTTGRGASCLGVPLAVGTRRADVLLLIATDARLPFAHADITLASQIARSAGLALENAHLYEREHHIAQTLQQSLLPAAFPQASGFEFAVVFAPMGEGNEVGGDFYDVFRKGAGYAAVVGDVCGKGPGAAKLTALCRYTLRTAAMFDDSGPSQTLALLNRAIIDQAPDSHFCTVAVADLMPTPLGTVRATISTGGHPPPLVARHDGTVEAAPVKGSVLGVIAEPPLGEVTIELAAGDALIFVTDGVEEARREDGALFGHARLRASLGQALRPGADAAALVAAIRDDLDAFRGSLALRDDLVILAVRFTGVEHGGRDDLPGVPGASALPAPS
jgi:serine phosphatase RsbU (regulator of sigma subunit)